MSDEVRLITERSSELIAWTFVNFQTVRIDLCVYSQQVLC